MPFIVCWILSNIFKLPDYIMKLEQLGFTDKIIEISNTIELDGFELGRVIIEHRERYIVQSVEGVYNAEITGNLRYSAKNSTDFPSVGDWVKIIVTDKESAIIIEVLPRVSVLERQAVGKIAETQVIAANIDFAFLVQSVGQNFNLKRFERYLTLCNSSGIEAIIILTKTDLIQDSEVELLGKSIKQRIKGVEVVALSNENMSGFEELESIMQPYKSYCFLGSSGVGKSTIINHLKGTEVLKTASISSSTNKGRHTTSHRELIILPNKSIVIDTPGMREIGMTDQTAGIERTYDEISDLAGSCKFNDCTHTNEVGCAVITAVKEGNIPESVYDNFLKLRREQLHFTSTLLEKKQKYKELGKMIKEVKKIKKQYKY